MIIVISIIAVVVFLVTNLIPGSPAPLILGEEATQEEIEQLEHELGLDRPVPVRFFLWIKDVLRGDLGESIYTRKPVLSVLISRLEPSLILTMLGTLIAIILGIPLGIIAAVFYRKPVDLSATILALIGISTPFFWLGLNLILLFSLVLKWFPAAGYVRLTVSPWKTFSHTLLPALMLGLHHSGSIARMTRANLLEVLRADYIRTARSKGLIERAVILGHGFRNSLVPTLSVIGVVIAVIIGGSPVTETVFAIPGVGRLMIESVLRRDFPMIQGVILLIAASVAFVNLIVDLSYAWLDPRITYV